jgi:hypothetical protein
MNARIGEAESGGALTGALDRGRWTLAAQEAEERDALAATCANCVVTSLRQAVEQVVNAANEAAAADFEDETRAPSVAPPASASADTVVEYPIVFDQTQRTEAIHEEADAAAGRADHLRKTASPHAAA